MSERVAGRLGRTVYGVSEGVRIAFGAIRANLFRSGLTILGIAIGVLVVVLIAALITGIRGAVAEEFESAGPRNLYVMRFDLSDVQLVQDGSQAPPWAGNPPVSVEETRRIDELPAIRSAVMSISLQAPGSADGLSVRAGTTEVTGIQAVGEAETWPEYRDSTFEHGRNFVSSEVVQGRAVTVLSLPLARDLFDDPGEAVGSRVRMGGGSNGTVPLTVVGVFEQRANLFSEEVGQLAIMPHTTALRRLNASEEWGQVVAVPHDEVPLDVAEDQVIGALRAARGLAPGEENDFAIMRSTQLLEIFDDFTAVFFVVMLALSSIGLLVGGVGVVGIMMISVTERTREIGVRKAVGASRPEILWQFLVEAGVLTLVGGAIGLAVGAALAEGVASLTPIPAAIPLWAVVAGLAMAAVTGMLFGMIPALRASRMDPVEALRYE